MLTLGNKDKDIGKNLLPYALWAISITVFLIIILWVLSNDLGYGKNELSNKSFEIFFFIRNGLLVATSFLGFLFLYQQKFWEFFNSLNYKLSIGGFATAIISGLLLGGLLDNFSMIPENPTFITYILMLSSVLFDRLFFSGFLGQNIIRSIPNKVISTILLSILYVAYTFTYEISYTINSPWAPILEGAIFYFGLSLPLAIIQVRTNSVLAPFLFQASFVIIGCLLDAFGSSRWLISIF